MISLSERFQSLYKMAPQAISSAPGRLEVLGNHTDYNAGLTLSCAVSYRCYTALAPLTEPVARLASTMFDTEPETFSLSNAVAQKGSWTNYILGLLAGLKRQGHAVPGFAMLVDSHVPASAGVSSSASLQMSVLTGLVEMLGLTLEPIELARLGQQAESETVGAQTGLLDQLSSLQGRRDTLMHIDFKTLGMDWVSMPAGWAFVVVDSGVKHDLTAEYNERRRSCEEAARVMGVPTLREADFKMLERFRKGMAEDAYSCALHVLSANQRVGRAMEALDAGDIETFGAQLFDSHESSRTQFRNSCPELDELVSLAKADARCLGARLSGGGFGGISIHLVRNEDAEAYRSDIVAAVQSAGRGDCWSAVCEVSDGARCEQPKD